MKNKQCLWMFKQCGFSNDLSMLATQIENSRSSRLEKCFEILISTFPSQTKILEG